MVGIVDPRSFTTLTERPADDRGQAYLPPNFANRLIAMGGFETTDCSKAVGPRNRFGDVPRNDALDAPPLLKNFQRSPVVPGGRAVAVRRQDRARRRQGPHLLKARRLGTEGSTPLTGRRRWRVAQARDTLVSMRVDADRSGRTASRGA